MTLVIHFLFKKEYLEALNLKCVFLSLLNTILRCSRCLLLVLKFQPFLDVQSSSLTQLKYLRANGYDVQDIGG